MPLDTTLPAVIHVPAHIFSHGIGCTRAHTRVSIARA